MCRVDEEEEHGGSLVREDHTGLGISERRRQPQQAPGESDPLGMLCLCRHVEIAVDEEKERVFGRHL